MPTNEEIVEQQNEEVVEPRTVSQLLYILETEGTFQGMTDAEIQSIIDYEKQRARIQGNTEQLETDFAAHCAAIQANTATALQSQETMLQSILNRASSPRLQVIQYG